MAKQQRIFLQIPIDGELKEAFMAKVKSQGKNATEVVNEMVRQYVAQSPNSAQDELSEIKKRLQALEQAMGGGVNKLREENEELKLWKQKLVSTLLKDE